MLAPLIRSATRDDIPLILDFIRGLADYEKLTQEVEATEEKLAATLFPPAGAATAYCVLAFDGAAPAGFAIYFFNYSTFLARPGLYLEDLFVRPEFRGRGIGKALLLHLADSRTPATAAAWSGPSSIGTSRRSSSTSRSAPGA